MKNIIKYGFIILSFLTIHLAQASDFTLVDADGDSYYIGEYLGNTMGNNSFYVEYSGNSRFSGGEGILYFDSYYQSVKIVIFENSDIYGFTLEGHWDGEGSTFYHVDSDGQSGDLRLYFEHGL